MPSIIIPAHNEANVIGRCLHGILDGARPDEFEVIVVCNGCSDSTASVARGISSAIRVIETGTASKSNALNLGDQAASRFPRFYVDADVQLPAESIRRVAAALADGQILAAAPMPHIDLARSTCWVRSFYRIWTKLPYVQAGIIGSGVYALTEGGRKRFSRFPDIISDDGYVRLLFSPQERETVGSAFFVITPPRSLPELISIKTRSHKGLLQLHRRYPELLRNEQPNYLRSLKEIMLRPRLWIDLPIYCCIWLLVKCLALWNYRFGGMQKWERDESSRQPQQ